jgi:hypothetical protein
VATVTEHLATTAADDPGPFFHGTKAELEPGDLLEPGRPSNFGQRAGANFIYLTSTLDAATWGAELALGDGPGRIYEVEPTGEFEDDPNLTEQEVPGQPHALVPDPLAAAGRRGGPRLGAAPARGAAGDARPPRRAEASGRRGDQRLSYACGAW